MSTASSQLLLIVDDQDPAFRYQGQWKTNTGPWYQSTCFYGFGNFSFSFNGSSVSFVGNTPAHSEYNATTGEPPTHTVMIDNDITYNATFPVGDESDPKVDQAYQWWYTSPFLDNTAPSQFNHSITIADTHNVAVDFAIITLTDPDTPLDLDSDPSGIGGRTRQVLVDDQDPEIHYEGEWVSTTNSRYLKFGAPGGYPVGNSTHQSRKDRDCLEFRFFGTSIDVYAIWFPPSSPASSSSTEVVSQHLYITLDGKPQLSAIQSHPLPDRSQNVLIYSTSSPSQVLSAGNHTLTLTYMQPESDTNVALMQYLLFDYITYTPSFSTLRDKPDLSVGYKGCRNLAPDDGDVPIGLIVGVVLGLFVCALGTIGYVWWRNKKKRRRRNGTGERKTAARGWNLGITGKHRRDESAATTSTAQTYIAVSTSEAAATVSSTTPNTGEKDPQLLNNEEGKGLLERTNLAVPKIDIVIDNSPIIPVK